MTTSPEGRKFIEQAEGQSLTAYQDGRGIWTICTGHTIGVRQGDTATPEQCDAFLADDLAMTEGAVNRLVKVPLNQNQFDALVSLVFNIGQGNFATSTILRLVNGGSVAAAADAFLMWDKVGGEVSPGLVRRRTAERAMFLEH
jgi:lysozyme